MIGSLKWFAHFLDPPSVKMFNSVLVSATVQGLKAQLSRPVRQKLPFFVDHLSNLHQLLNLSDTKQLSAWCAMLLAFFGCFRLSNLVPASKAKTDPFKYLKRDDIIFEKDLVLIYYKWSKTNQNSSREAWIPLCSVADNRFNLKYQLKQLFHSVKVPSDAPLFTFYKENFHSKSSLVKLLDLCVYIKGLSPADYSWHSFRRGAAVFAFELGLCSY